MKDGIVYDARWFTPRKAYWIDGQAFIGVCQASHYLAKAYSVTLHDAYVYLKELPYLQNAYVTQTDQVFFVGSA